MKKGGTSQRTEDQVAALLSRLSLTEKIGQMVQFAPFDYGSRRAEYLEGVRGGRWGSMILATSAWAGSDHGPSVDLKMLAELQRAAVEESPHGIPLLIGRDVIYGHRTVFPIPLAQAASFDPAGTEEAMHGVACEARAEGIHWTFSPMLDIARDPRWGRIIEGYGEDPHLAALFAAAAVRGFQGDNPAQPDRILACAKHFCGYGFVQGGRDYDAADISGDTLHNVVLAPFRAAIRAGVATVMTAFNEIGGVPASAHEGLLRGWLKEGQGWPGMVVSDWSAIMNLVDFRVAADLKDAACLAVRAGVDVEMTEAAYSHLEKLVREGAVPESLIDDAAKRVLRAKFLAGLFDRPYACFEPAAQAAHCAAHRKHAAAFAARCPVLLRNRGGVLPLPQQGRIALAGPYVEARREHLGSWCLDGRPDEVVTIAAGLRAASPQLEVVVGEVAWAGATVLVLCVGESHEHNGEHRSTTRITLPPDQEALIARAAAAGCPMVVVNCSGRPLSSPAAEAHADAILHAWNLGSEAGTAIAAVLTGAVDSSGRLPVSVPRHEGQLPIHYNRKTPGKVRELGKRYVGYLDEALEPLYPFGFGLSYTTFDYGPVRLDAETLQPGGELLGRVAVTNTGSRAGTAVVQVYLGGRHAPVTRPDRELKGIQRLDLAAGETREAVFTIKEDQLVCYFGDGTPCLPPGLYDLWVGGDCHASEHATFRVNG